MKKTTFKLIFEENFDFYRKGDTLNGKIAVISTPKMHWWQRFKKFIGLNYEWYYKVKKL